MQGRRLLFASRSQLSLVSSSLFFVRKLHKEAGTPKKILKHTIVTVTIWTLGSKTVQHWFIREVVEFRNGT